MNQDPDIEQAVESYIEQGLVPSRSRVSAEHGLGSHRAAKVQSEVRYRIGRPEPPGRAGERQRGIAQSAAILQTIAEPAYEGQPRHAELDESSLFEIAVASREGVKDGTMGEAEIQARYGVGLNHARSIVFGVMAGLFDGAEASTRDVARYAANTQAEHPVLPWKGNILVIGDTHIPFEHPKYLEFCLRTRDAYKCEQVIHIGDEVDNHALSFHTGDPDGYGPGMEASAAMSRLRRWQAAFPEVLVTGGNHSNLPMRRAYANGIPKAMMRTYEEIWQAPPGWRWVTRVTVEGADGDVRFQHGTGKSGGSAAMNWAKANLMSTVIGHVHSFGGCQHIDNGVRSIFALNAGCGIDEAAYAFAYGKDFAYKPTLGCGVVLDEGTTGQFVSMRRT